MAITFEINGHTYTTDRTNVAVPVGYRFYDYGYIPALANLSQDIIAVAAAAVSGAAEQVGLAQQKVVDAAEQVGLAADQVAIAQAAAATAVNAPGTSATSTSNIVLGNGARTAIIQPGKNIVPGLRFTLARTSDPVAKRGSCVANTYDSVTGQLDFTLATTATGTYSDWTISLAGEPAAGGGITTVTASSVSATLHQGELLRMTPADIGVVITLDVGTSFTKGASCAAVDNTAGVFPLVVRNSAGTLLGFIAPGVFSQFNCIDNTDAPGSFSFSGRRLVGPTSRAIYQSACLALVETIALDADRDFLLCYDPNNGYLYGIVHRKSTNAYAGPTSIRSASISTRARCILQTTNQVLVVSIDATTALEAVVLSINAGTDAITPNAATPATLSANQTGFSTDCGLIQVGTSFVCSYSVETPACQIREITVAGTTPTIGAATVLGGNVAPALIAAVTGSVLLAVSCSTSTIYARPYSIGGLAAGTGATYAPGTVSSVAKLLNVGDRFAALSSITATDQGTHCSLISVAGTVATMSNVKVFSGANYLSDAMTVGTDKILVGGTNTSSNLNIVTDTAGTASAGTAITAGSGSSRIPIYANGNTVMLNGNGQLFKIDCSGASPVIKMLYTSFNAAVFAVSGPRGRRSGSWFYGTRFATNLGAFSTYTPAMQVKDEIPLLAEPSMIGEGANLMRGPSDSVRWHGVNFETSGGSSLVRYECVA